MSERQELVKEVKEAEDRLKRYDEFFDGLKVGQTIYEELTYDSSPVKVLSWNKNKGTVFCEYRYGGDLVKKNIEHYSLALEPREFTIF